MQSITHYMPDAKPAPYVMTADEVIHFLRIGGDAPSETLRYYREKGWLKGTQVSKNVRFLLPDVVDFLERSKKENPR